MALELARSLGLNLPLAQATKEQYDRMIAEGFGELDNPASPSSPSRIAISAPAIAYELPVCTTRRNASDSKTAMGRSATIRMICAIGFWLLAVSRILPDEFTRRQSFSPVSLELCKSRS